MPTFSDLKLYRRLTENRSTQVPNRKLELALLFLQGAIEQLLLSPSNGIQLSFELFRVTPSGIVDGESDFRTAGGMLDGLDP